MVISDIPLIKPIAGVRVGFVNNAFIVNPTVEEQKQSKLDLLLAGTEDAVLMIEGFCDFLTEEQALEAISLSAIRTSGPFVMLYTNGRRSSAKEKNRTTLRPLGKEVLDAVHKIAAPLLEKALRIELKKQVREDAQSAVKEAVNKALMPKGEEPKFPPADIAAALKQVSSTMMRR